MIEASFDRHGRTASVGGIYQYDTGQRLRMRGLPSPEELLSGDDLLSGNAVTVQAHFGYVGDSQAEARLAEWNADVGAWIVPIPDEYLTRSEDVHVFVEAYYGADDTGGRVKTCYDGVFRPISRPASKDTVTEEQLTAWATLEAEIDLSLATVGMAQANAEGKAQTANEAAETANAAAGKARTAAQDVRNAANALNAAGNALARVTIQTVALPVGSQSGATLENGVLTYKIPTGATGAKGATGDTGPSDLALSFSNGVLTITKR